MPLALSLNLSPLAAQAAMDCRTAQQPWGHLAASDCSEKWPKSS